MVNAMFCIFHHSLKNKLETKKERKEKAVGLREKLGFNSSGS